MSRGYKRRKKLIARGVYETPAERSVRVIGEFAKSLEKLLNQHGKTMEQQPATTTAPKL